MQIDTVVSNVHGWVEGMTLNGELGERQSLGGVRTKFKFPEQGLIGMVCSMHQCAQEARTWHNLKSEHRSVFMPILGGGDITLVPRPDDQYCRSFDFCIKPWYEGLIPARDEKHHCTVTEFIPLHDSLTELVRSYGIGDWDARQWKMSASGLPIIHDYGIGGLDPSNYKLPDWWQKITLDNWWVKR